jgi:hypothetical protein
MWGLKYWSNKLWAKKYWSNGEKVITNAINSLVPGIISTPNDKGAPCYTPLIGLIVDDDTTGIGAIDPSNTGLVSSIISTIAFNGTIVGDNINLIGTIDPANTGLISTISPSIGIVSTICQC